MTETEGTVSEAAATPVAGRPFLWMAPAWVASLVRPGFAAVILADAARLRELPGSFARVGLPLAAVALPLGLSILHAMRPVGSFENYLEPSPWTFLIWTTFTQSISFVALAAAIGLLSPAAGALLTVTYALTDIPAALVTNEMYAFPGAILGRIASYGLLWLLAVEIPVLARGMFEAISPTDDAPRQRRQLALVLAAAVAGGLTYIWAEATRQLIGAVHYLSALTVPAEVYTALYDTSVILGIGGAAVAAGAFWLRYLGPSAHVARQVSDEEPDRGRPRLSYLAGAAVAFLLLSGYIDQPIDAVILIAAILASRPLATTILRATGLGGILVRIPWPIRLIAGFGLTFVLASVYLQAMGISQVSRFGYMVIAVAGGMILIELLTSAEEAVGPRVSRARAVAEGVTVGSLLFLAFPLVVAAHSGHQEANAAAGAAAAGGAAAAALAKRRQGQKATPIPRPKPIMPPSSPWDRKAPGPPRPDGPLGPKPKKPPEPDSPLGNFSKPFKDFANSFKSFFGGK